MAAGYLVCQGSLVQYLPCPTPSHTYASFSFCCKLIGLWLSLWRVSTGIAVQRWTLFMASATVLWCVFEQAGRPPRGLDFVQMSMGVAGRSAMHYSVWCTTIFFPWAPPIVCVTSPYSISQFCTNAGGEWGVRAAGPTSICER